ncbi:MAG: hypothetical protein GKR95_22265 [Gammaproteobacteria bacterium]|nr:hypothetical protein [Gammaproteobacteria bacterium]
MTLGLLAVVGLVSYGFQRGINQDSWLSVVTACLALFLLINDLHRDWLDSLERRVSVLIYDAKTKVPQFIYFRSSCYGNDLRGLAQQLASQAILSSIYESYGKKDALRNSRVTLFFDPGRVTYATLRLPYRHENGRFTIEHMVFIPVNDIGKTIHDSLEIKEKDEKSCTRHSVRMSDICNNHLEATNKNKVFWATAVSDEWRYRPFVDLKKELEGEFYDNFISIRTSRTKSCE